MIQQYSESRLQKLSISQLRDICRQLSIPTRRSKADCVADILAAQPQLIAPTCATCPYFQPHNDGSDKGWCSLFDNFARECHPQVQDCLNNFPEEVEEEIADDYLFQEEEPQTQPNLPQVGDVVVLAGYIMRCTNVGGRHATIWDVFEGNRALDRMYMRWDGFWERCLSYGKFRSIQEAIADLASSQEFLERGTGRIDSCKKLHHHV